MVRKWKGIAFAVVTLALLIWLDTYPAGRDGERAEDDDDLWPTVRDKSERDLEAEQVFMSSQQYANMSLAKISDSHKPKSLLKRAFNRFRGLFTD